MGDSSAHHSANQRLDSWKEIAAFFNRDERTVRRWEKERGLPIHRVPGGERGGVFAYTGELSEWFREPGHEADHEQSFARNGTPEPNVPASELPLNSDPSSELPAQDVRTDSSFVSSLTRLSLTRILVWIAPLVVVSVLIAFASLSHRQVRYKNALAAPHAPNPEAQELYLKGEYHWTKRTPDDLNKAVDYFTQSIVKDPSYAQPYAGLADCYNLLREFSAMLPEEAFPRALSAAQKAVELDPRSPAAHNALAFVTYYWNWDPVTAEREYKRTLQLDPNFVQGHHWYATFLLANGRSPEALDQIEQARKLDPASTTIQADKALILTSLDRKSEAFALLQQLESTDPTLASTHRYLAMLYLDRVDYRNFLLESKRAAQLRHDEAGLAVAKAAEQGYLTGGVRGMRHGMLVAQQAMLERNIGSAFDLASTCAEMGKKDEALNYLQIAFQKRDAGLLYLNRNPVFNALHDDSRFNEMVVRVEARMFQTLPTQKLAASKR